MKTEDQIKQSINNMQNEMRRIEDQFKIELDKGNYNLAEVHHHHAVTIGAWVKALEWVLKKE